jgi:hypothetical protein
MTLQQVARALGGEVSGGQVLAPGPKHSPKDRSLAVKLDDHAPDGFVVHSFANDDPLNCRDYVRHKLGLPPFGSNGASAAKPVMVARYDYTDENGELLFQVVRYEPKNFRQRRPDGRGGWVWQIGETRRVLYRLPELIKAVAARRTICICEGERAVESLFELGITATCSPGGAGKWRAEYAKHLAGAKVLVLPDNDEPGKQHAEAVAKSLKGIASDVKVLRLPGLPPRGDPYDWVQGGGTVDQLRGLVKASGGATQSGKVVPREVWPRLVMRCAADIEPEPIDWSWQDRLARGKLTVIGGDPEEGKSQVSNYIAATISVGGDWPNNEGQAPLGSVIILSAEDGAEDTLVPRLIAAGADRSKIHLIEAVREEDEKGRRTFNLQTDLQMLEEKITELGDVQAVIVDPASAYMGKKVDSHNDQAVRSVLAPVAEMAHRLRVAIVSIMHFNKGNSQAGTKVMHRFMASIAFVAAARIAFAALRDPEDDKRHLFLHAKNNLAPPPPGLAYRIEQAFVTDMRIKTSHIVWEEGSVDITAAEAMAASQGKDAAPALEEAKQFLAGLIGPDGMLVKEIEKEAKEARISWATVRRAKDALKLNSAQVSFAGPWKWKR